ncbi:hypothetical protein pdam_00006077 [Pocillopora damicornis]|uniref:Uncharacterized protein n=1 Tax=Pocillopora damicornis TaxID=46731 RepID=A0A3M6TTC9_POCDA|nr:hypothetical protein pdam_00006077 [Pocillopora damicornis]
MNPKEFTNRQTSHKKRYEGTAISKVHECKKNSSSSAQVWACSFKLNAITLIMIEGLNTD